MVRSNAARPDLRRMADFSKNDPTQVDVVETYLSLHLPWIFAGGIGVEGGLFVTRKGAEHIYVSGHLLYTVPTP